MSTIHIPAEVLSLLRHRVATFEQLEILLLLHDHAGAQWSARTVSAQLRIETDLVLTALNELLTNQLLRVELVDSVPVYHYAPVDTHLAHSVGTLARSSSSSALTS